MTLPFHPLSEIFPAIDGPQFDELVADICLNGVREPIVIHEKAVLDGRNRFRALLAIKERGLLRGAGWGVYRDTPITDEDLDPNGDLSWFEFYSTLLSGNPLLFVVSKNLLRRHLTPSQRAMLVADLGKLGWGGDRSKPSREGLSISERALAGRIGHATVERADSVKERGIPELQEAVRKGSITVAPAADIARRPEVEQREQLIERGILPKGARAIMSSRTEPDDSLDYFPTPPWATRALVDIVLPELGININKLGSAWEPACGEGHIAEVLRERFATVTSTDIFSYGYGTPDYDFINRRPDPPEEACDWIITNPPFGDAALQFVLRALDLATVGVAMFFRSQWAVEGIERYETIFRDRPPTLCAFFVERVNLCKGRWDPDGSTATAYCWLVWRKNPHTKSGLQPARAPFWIPPGQRDALSRSDDVERFTAHPVTKREIQPDAPPSVAPIQSVVEPASDAGESIPVAEGAGSQIQIDDGIPDFLRRVSAPA